MTRRIKANGEGWEIHLSRERPHAGIRPLIFRCTTNSSFGWRVVEVPATDFEGQEQVERLSDDSLHALFEESQPFDYSHDPKAKPDAIGDSAGR